MSSVFQGQGVALNNGVGEIVKAGESLGPVTFAVHNDGDVDVCVQITKQSDSSVVAADTDTAVTDEDTGYDGDASTLVFSGEALNNVPIVPGTVTVKPTAGGNTVNATDRDGDGNLYTDDNDEDFCGTVDYFSGALELSYPTGKDPNTTNILADYTYQDAVVVPGGAKSYYVGSNPPAETLILKAAADGGTAKIKCDAFISLDA